MLDILKEKKFKLLIALAFIFTIIILLNTKVYAGGISINGTNNTIIKNQSAIYTVYNATKAGNWSVYPEKNNNVISTSKLDANHISCKALNIGTARLCVRDGITGSVGYMDITVKTTTSDFAIHIKGGIYDENNRTLYLFKDFSSTWTIRSRNGWSISSPNYNPQKIKLTKYPKGYQATGTDTISFTATNEGETNITVKEYYSTRNPFTIKIKVLKPVTGISIKNIPTRKKSRSK